MKLVDSLIGLTKERRSNPPATRPEPTKDEVREKVMSEVFDGLVRRASAGCCTYSLGRYFVKCEYADDIVRDLQIALTNSGLCHTVSAEPDVYHDYDGNIDSVSGLSHLYVEVSWVENGHCLTCGELHIAGGRGCRNLGD